MGTARILPHNIEAEKSVLGAMLLSSEATNNIGLLQPSDFYLLAHQKIYEAIISLYNKNTNIDTVTVADELEQAETLENVGSYKYLTDLTDFVPVLSNITGYIDIVKGCSLNRQLLEISNKLSDVCYDNEPPSKNIEYAEQSMYDLTKDITADIVTARELANTTLKRIERRQNGQSKLIKTGFIELDDLIGGIDKSEFIIIPARPSMGKTALALKMAYNMTNFQNKKVLFISLETDKETIMQRLYSITSGIAYEKMNKENGLTDTEWDKISDAADEIGKLNIIVIDEKCNKLNEIRALIRRTKPDIVFIDYLQLINAQGKGLYEKVTNISQQLKSMNMALKIPIVALAQLSRDVEKRHNNRPILSDIRDSGAIEQDANKVIALYRADWYGERDQEDYTPTKEAELIVLKSKETATGTAKCKFRAETMNFYDQY